MLFEVSRCNYKSNSEMARYTELCDAKPFRAFLSREAECVRREEVPGVPRPRAPWMRSLGLDLGLGTQKHRTELPPSRSPGG